jgi:hypothetical protein
MLAEYLGLDFLLAMVMIIPGDTDAAGLARMQQYNQGVDMLALQAGVANHRDEIQRTQATGRGPKSDAAATH